MEKCYEWKSRVENKIFNFQKTDYENTTFIREEINSLPQVLYEL